MFRRPELDSMLRRGCGVSHCIHRHEGPVFIHSKCHERAPLWLAYHGGGVLEALCSKCRRRVAMIEVAGEAEPNA